MAINTAERFEIGKNKAAKTAAEIIKTVGSNWMRIASDCGISRGKIELMRPAFGLSL